MKYLSIIARANPEIGGPIQGIRNLEFEIFKLESSMEIVTFEEPEDVLKWNFSETIIIHALGKSQTALQFNKKLFSFLQNNLSKYDVVLIHGLWLYHSFCTVKAFKWLMKNKPELVLPKLYCFPHGMLDPWFQKEKTRKIKSIRNSIYWHLVEKNVISNLDGLLFTCEQELLRAKASFLGYNPKKELNVGYGIIQPPKNNSLLANAFVDFYTKIKGERYFLFLSRIHFKKGVDLLIKSYNYLSNQKFDLPHLVIAGSYDSSYAKKMMSLSNNNPKIHFPGMLNGDVKWAAFYGCEAFILPSHQENFGIAVAEALACGKPVLISNKVNIFREIENGNAGIINEDTLEGTISNLRRWFDLSLVEKKKMSNSAFEVYLKYFTIEESARKLMEIIGK